MTRHFLTMDSLSSAELVSVLDRAAEMKRTRARSSDLAGRSVAMIFEKPSTRTRISFEVGIAELGATPVVLNASELQLGRGETIEDTARVLSRYVHGVVVRTFEQARLDALASAGSIPVINALSDHEHPCQILADLLTIRERLGRLEGVRVAYVGDGNNVAHSLLVGCALAGASCTVGSPEGYMPDEGVVKRAVEIAAGTGSTIEVTDSAQAAVRGADVVYTDVWASMGQESEAEGRADVFRPFQVNEDLMAVADEQAVVLHCLPAHRGEEITAGVLDGARSAVWDQAENRLHAQKALMAWLLG